MSEQKTPDFAAIQGELDAADAFDQPRVARICADAIVGLTAIIEESAELKSVRTPTVNEAIILRDQLQATLRRVIPLDATEQSAATLKQAGAILA
jgi:hypothetical protein